MKKTNMDVHQWLCRLTMKKGKQLMGTKQLKMNALSDLGGCAKCVTLFETFIRILFAIVLVIFAIFYMFGYTCNYVTTNL
jgi:hypothetical protein